MSTLDFEADAIPEKTILMAREQTIGHNGSLGLRLKLHTDLDDLKTPWTEFEDQAVATLFQTYHYLSSWMRYVGLPQGIEPLVVTGHMQDGSLAFILPFQLEKKGLFRILSWMGKKEATYRAGLYSEDFLNRIEKNSFKILWQDILKILPGFDVVRLINQREMLGRHPNPFLYLSHIPAPDDYYDFALEEDYAKLYASKRKSKSRQTSRWRDKKIGELGQVEFTKESEAEEITSILEAMMSGKNEQLARFGNEEIFSKEVCQFFLQLSLPPKNKPPLFELHTIKLDGKLIAGQICSSFKDTYYAIIVFMQKGEYEKFSQGNRLLRDTIQWACENGYKTYDLSNGFSPDKGVWGDGGKTLFQTVIGQNFQGIIYAMMIRTKTFLKRRVKSSPYLKRFLIKVLSRKR